MIAAVTGNQRNDMIVGINLDARIIEGLGLCAAQEIQESLGWNMFPPLVVIWWPYMGMFLPGLL